MTVFTPSTDLTARPTPSLSVSAGWEADVVSGASERVKSGPVYTRGLLRPEVISGASVHDVRHQARGSISVRREDTQLSAGGSTSKENDYKSNSLHAGATTDLFQHDTTLGLDYARNWDSVCDLAHRPNTQPELRGPLPTSARCFDRSAESSTQDARTTVPIRSDAFQASWSQAWTPALTTDMVYTAQLQHGMLSDPYRAVVLGLGRAPAQEHHPDDRARQSLGLHASYYWKPLKGVIRAGVRGYRDTWDVRSVTFDLELEKYFASWLRGRVRGRAYTQTAALFWSDDYVGGEPDHGPRGQYWSGDRELSPFTSYSAGVRALASWAASERRLLGVFQGFEASVSVDALFFDYHDFTLGGTAVKDTTAYIGSLGFTALF